MKSLSKQNDKSTSKKIWLGIIKAIAFGVLIIGVSLVVLGWAGSVYNDFKYSKTEWRK